MKLPHALHDRLGQAGIAGRAIATTRNKSGSKQLKDGLALLSPPKKLSIMNKDSIDATQLL